jgi:hypothetical protein
MEAKNTQDPEGISPASLTIGSTYGSKKHPRSRRNLTSILKGCNIFDHGSYPWALQHPLKRVAKKKV